MPSPCGITFNGKEYSYEDFAAYLHDGGLDKLVADKIVDDSGFKLPPIKQGEEQINEGAGRVKKTLVTKRVYEGTIREAVKKRLEEIGLTREVESHEDAAAKAKQFVDDVGYGAAIEAVDNGDIRGSNASLILGMRIFDIDAELATETDNKKIAALEKEQTDLTNKLGELNLESGRLNSVMSYVYHNFNIGYNVEKQISKFKQQNGGEISPETEAKIRDIDGKLKELNKRIAALEKDKAVNEGKKIVADIKTAAERVKEKVERKRGKDLIAEGLDELVNALGGTKKAFGEKKPEVSKALEKIGKGLIEEGIATLENVSEKVKEYIKEKYGEVFSFDPYEEGFSERIGEQLRAESTEGKLQISKNLIRQLVQGGIDNIEDLTAAVKERIKDKYPNATDREIRDAITGYGKTANLSQEEVDVRIRKMNRIGRVISGLEDIAEKKRPLRSGQQRDKLDAQERAMQKELREALKELPLDTEAEQVQLKSALDAIKTRLRNQIEDLTREIETRQKVEKAGKDVEYDTEAKELQAERDRLREVHDEIFGKGQLTDEQRIQRAEKALERSIAGVEERIKNKELEIAKTEPAQSEKLTELRDKLKQRRDVLKQMQDEAGIAEKKRLAAAKKSVERYLNELKRRIAEKDFEKKKRTPVIEDTELTRARAEKIRLQEQYDKLFYENQLKNMNNFEKAKEAVWQGWRLSQMLRATGDLSFVFVQGLNQTIAHPLNAIEAFKISKKNIFSEKHTEEWLSNLKAQDFYPILKQSKLAISEPSGKLTAHEEYFYTGWTNMIWDRLVLPLKLKSESAYEKAVAANPFKALERGAVGYLDTLRVLRFLDGMEKMKMEGKNFATNKQEFKDIADGINTLTGRSSLGPLESSAEILSKIFFSPRLWVSGLKTTIFSPVYLMSLTPTARKMVFADLAKQIGITTSMLAMAAAYLNNDDDKDTHVELDPRSTEFGKVKLGNKIIDPWGGKIQYAILFSRLVGESLHKAGVGEGGMKKGQKVFPLGSQKKGEYSPTALGLVGQMAVNKLGPSAGIFYRATTTHEKNGKTIDQWGNEYSLGEDILNNLYPIYGETLYELYKDDPSALNGILAFYGLFGGGVQVYDNKGGKKPTSGKADVFNQLPMSERLQMPTGGVNQMPLEKFNLPPIEKK